MFTSVDKALVGLIMAVVFIANNVFGINLGIGEDLVNTVAGILTPILVYFVPNKK